MKTPLALCALCLSLSVAAQTPLYRVMEAPDYGSIESVNNFGEYVYQRGTGSFDYVFVGRTGTVSFPSQSPGSFYDTLVVTALSDDGTVLGYQQRTNSLFMEGSAAIWQKNTGWNLMPPVNLMFTQAVGRAINGGRVLLNGGDHPFMGGNIPGWWTPGQAPTGVAGGYGSRSVGMDANGNALFTANASSNGLNFIVHADNSRTLLLASTFLEMPFISSHGYIVSQDIAGSPYGGPRLHYIHRPDGTVLQTMWLGSPVESADRSITLSSMNSQLEAVGRGWGSASQYRAVYWSAMTGLVDLQTRLTADSSSWILVGAGQINDRGEILAGVRKADWEPFVTKRVLLQPVPEPATLTALALGLMACLRRKRAQKS